MTTLRNAAPKLRVLKTDLTESPELLTALDAVSAFAAKPAYQRQRIERTIDALLMILDAMDGDPNLEEDGEDRCPAHDDDPSPMMVWGDGYLGDPDDGEDNGDREPSTEDTDDGVRVGRTNPFWSPRYDPFAQRQPVEASHG